MTFLDLVNTTNIKINYCNIYFNNTDDESYNISFIPDFLGSLFVMSADFVDSYPEVDIILYDDSYYLLKIVFEDDTISVFDCSCASECLEIILSYLPIIKKYYVFKVI